MANARALDKRRKSIRNIRKITRTMELIATARFKKAMDRATAATSPSFKAASGETLRRSSNRWTMGSGASPASAAWSCSEATVGASAPRQSTAGRSPRSPWAASHCPAAASRWTRAVGVRSSSLFGRASGYFVVSSETISVIRSRTALLAGLIASRCSRSWPW